MVHADTVFLLVECTAMFFSLPTLLCLLSTTLIANIYQPTSFYIPAYLYNKSKKKGHTDRVLLLQPTHVMAAIVAACGVVSLVCAALVVGKVVVADSFSFMNISSTKMCARKYKIDLTNF